MQVFEPKSKTKSVHERARDLVDREMGLLLAEKKRVEAEVLGRISAVNDSLKSIEDRAFKKADLLRSEISDLEQRKAHLEASIKALESHPDEAAYKAKHAALSLKEQELESERLRVASELAAVDNGRTKLARLMEENENELNQVRSELSEREQKVLSMEREALSKQSMLSEMEKELLAKSSMVEKRIRDLDAKEEQLLARERGTEELMKTLNDTSILLGRERRALKDAYAELERSKQRLERQYGKR